jgi:hypothetical protein
MGYWGSPRLLTADHPLLWSPLREF